MMKSILVLSAVASVALAQSNSDPLIPNNISAGCKSTMTAINNDASLASCFNSLIQATNAFSPSTLSASGSANPGASAVSSALTNLCSTNTQNACPTATIRSHLADLFTACSDELVGSNKNVDVQRTYDLLYFVSPFNQAICSKDESGKFCVNSIPASLHSSSGSTVSHSAADSQTVLDGILANLAVPVSSSSSSPSKRADTPQAVLIPNTTTINSANILLLMLTPSTPTTTLCQPCTRNVLSPYIQFESTTPYAPGLPNSLIMSGQPALYSAVLSQCGQNFMSGAVQAAGGLSGGIVPSNDASSLVSGGALQVMSAAVAAGVFALL